MNAMVISTDIELPDTSEITAVRRLDENSLAHITAQATGPVYLCGGGHLAGALLQMNAISRVVLKRALIVLGGSVSLFGQVQQAQQFRRVRTKTYDNGYLLEEFEL